MVTWKKQIYQVEQNQNSDKKRKIKKNSTIIRKIKIKCIKSLKKYRYNCIYFKIDKFIFVLARFIFHLQL